MFYFYTLDGVFCFWTKCTLSTAGMRTSFKSHTCTLCTLSCSGAELSAEERAHFACTGFEWVHTPAALGACLQCSYSSMKDTRGGSLLRRGNKWPRGMPLKKIKNINLLDLLFFLIYWGCMKNFIVKLNFPFNKYTDSLMCNIFGRCSLDRAHSFLFILGDGTPDLCTLSIIFVSETRKQVWVYSNQHIRFHSSAIRTQGTGNFYFSNRTTFNSGPECQGNQSDHNELLLTVYWTYVWKTCKKNNFLLAIAANQLSTAIQVYK